MHLAEEIRIMGQKICKHYHKEECLDKKIEKIDIEKVREELEVKEK